MMNTKNNYVLLVSWPWNTKNLRILVNGQSIIYPEERTYLQFQLIKRLYYFYRETKQEEKIYKLLYYL